MNSLLAITDKINNIKEQMSEMALKRKENEEKRFNTLVETEKIRLAKEMEVEDKRLEVYRAKAKLSQKKKEIAKIKKEIEPEEKEQSPAFNLCGGTGSIINTSQGKRKDIIGGAF